MTRIELRDPALRRLYTEFARRTTGLLDRSEWLWRRTLDPVVSLDLSAYLLGPADAPEGYLRVPMEHEPGARYGTLRVRDRAFLTPRSMRRALSFFAGHRSMIERVCLCGGVIEPL